MGWPMQTAIATPRRLPWTTDWTLGLALVACGASGCAASSAAVTGDAAVTRAEPRAAEAPTNTETTEHTATGALQPLTPTPWTRAFAAKAVVVANHVRIEGPDGLLEHLVVSSDDAYFERQVTHEGQKLTQITTRISADVPEIRAQLDAWQLAAFERVTVIEHLVPKGAKPRAVTVVATGEAVFRDPNGVVERAETLRWDGTIGE